MLFFSVLLCSRGGKAFHAKRHSAMQKDLAALCTSSAGGEGALPSLPTSAVAQPVGINSQNRHGRHQRPLALHYEFVHPQPSTPSPTVDRLNPAPTMACVVRPVCVPPMERRDRGGTSTRCAARATRQHSPAGAGGGRAPCGPCVRRRRRNAIAAGLACAATQSPSPAGAGGGRAPCGP